jgi:hypothetical protein
MRNFLRARAVVLAVPALAPAEMQKANSIDESKMFDSTSCKGATKPITSSGRNPTMPDRSWA